MNCEEIKYEVSDRIATLTLHAEGIAAFKEKRAPRFGMRPSRDMPGFYPWWKERPFE
jgi:hypothetical protein